MFKTVASSNPNRLALSSSNFFMQVLNAPSREELDTAHAKGNWLEIGVSSMRNAFKVSRFKTLCWLGLSVTSIPIHLLFNSVIFGTEYRGSNFTVTIATEEFLSGGNYYLPGASLLTADGLGQFYTSGILPGFGQLFNLTQYSMTGPGVAKNVSDAALHGKEWSRLDLSECKREFGLYGTPCSGLARYRDVILIVQNPTGWVRNEMWHLMENQTRIWDLYVPADKPNHLFYYTACTMDGHYGPQGGCKCSCDIALGGRSSRNYEPEIENWPFGYPFFAHYGLSFANGTDDISSGSWYGNELTSGLKPGTFNLSVQYCLARSIESTCRIGVSPALFLAVVLCIIGKTSIAVLVTIVLGRWKQASLVTFGDYLASLIETPAVETSCFSATGVAELGGRIIFPGRRRWQMSRRRRASVIPLTVWLISCGLLVLAIAAIAALLTYSALVSRGIFIGEFLASSQNPLIGLQVSTFLGCVLVANSPQVVLSLWYFTFNNLFTYLQVADEWEQFSTDYLPLRVTNPMGKQKSTYRLQLPYRYSLPLIALSALSHWLLSNTIYIILSTGEYLQAGYSDYRQGLSDPSLSADIVVALGYSPISLFVVVVLSSIAVTIPVFFSLKRVSSDIVPVGTNSLLISMACRVSPLSLTEKNAALAPGAESEYELSAHTLPGLDVEGNEETDSLMQLETLRFPLEPHDDTAEDGEGHGAVQVWEHRGNVDAGEMTSNAENSESHIINNNNNNNNNITYNSDLHSDVDDGPNDLDSVLRKVARSKIRWGVLKMPPEWYEEHDYEPLGFGVEGEEVTAPVEGRWYF
ncbi:hypothetical protein HD806DRAFT_521724 [Xylariaceae sp. AK1471]|nr:hypothetical protein HD806DRAFT_521724 [Xylariaceae sp. AK1471]